MTNATYQTHYQCIESDCGATYALTDLVFQCRRCGGLLEVVHDRRAWRKAGDADQWRRLFGARWRSPDPVDGSGVWGKHEWVMPAVDRARVVTLGEGATPLVSFRALADDLDLADVWIKQCGISHTGSFKDLGMTVLVSMVAELRARGTEIPALVCASTGDTSAALAAYGAVAGLPTVVVLPRGKVSTAQLVQPLANGATVLSLDTDFDGCMALVRWLSEEKQLYLANSMNSLRIEGQKTVAYDIAQQLGWRVPDWVVIPGGNLGNVSALAKGFDDLHALGLIAERPRILCAQAAKADPLYRSYRKGWAELAPVTAGDTAASAIRIGNPVSFPKAVAALKRYDGMVAHVTEDALAESAAWADRAGAYACPHTSVALAALREVRAQGVIAADATAVVVSTAHGLKFTEFKIAYHEGRLDEAACRHRNRPLEVPAEREAVWSALQRDLETKARAGT